MLLKVQIHILQTPGFASKQVATLAGGVCSTCLCSQSLVVAEPSCRSGPWRCAGCRSSLQRLGLRAFLQCGVFRCAKRAAQVYGLLQRHVERDTFLKQLELAKVAQGSASMVAVEHGSEVLRETWWEPPAGEGATDAEDPAAAMQASQRRGCVHEHACQEFMPWDMSDVVREQVASNSECWVRSWGE